MLRRTVQTDGFLAAKVNLIKNIHLIQELFFVYNDSQYDKSIIVFIF